MIDQNTNHMEYQEGMEAIDGTLMEDIVNTIYHTDFDAFTAKDVRRALNADQLSELDFTAFLSPAAEPFLDELAHKAQQLTRRYFGNTVSLFTPLYIANYCENHCVYCGWIFRPLKKNWMPLPPPASKMS